MPLVRITLSSEIDTERRHRIADGVHKALVGALELPVDNVFQLVCPMPPEDIRFDPAFMGVSRTTVVCIEITLVVGRSDDKKKALYRSIADNLARDCGVRPGDVFIVLTENSRADWSVGEGIAQLI